MREMFHKQGLRKMIGGPWVTKDEYEKLHTTPEGSSSSCITEPQDVAVPSDDEQPSNASSFVFVRSTEVEKVIEEENVT